jgi:radical SAM superfamily enzyme YgiQ (UPF0313 family)/glycosyltransferase involved in cell wall biosynthesis
MDNVSAIKKNIKELKVEFYRSPKDIIVLVNLGKRLLDCCKYKDSIAWFEKALILDKNNIEAIDGLAKAFLECGLFYSARKYFERSLKASSGQANIRRILASLKNNPSCREEKVAFYVPCFNVEKYIAKCIEAILNQSYPIKEILIIDDGSTDKTADIASKYPVRIIRHEKNMGLSSARNTAIREAKGDYIASVDADVVLDKYWLEYLLSNFIDSSIGGSGGKLLEENTLTAVDRWRQVNMAQNWGKNREVNPHTLVGSNTVYRRRCLGEAGGYNEKFANNHEDTDMGLRVKMLDYNLIYDPRAIAHHLRRDNIKSLLNTYWRYYRTPAGELISSYNNFKTLVNKMDYNAAQSSMKVTKSLRGKTFQLLYLDILSGFWNALEDIIYIGRYSKLPEEVVSQTFLATLAGFRYLLERKKGVARELIAFILDDLKYLMNLLKEEYKTCTKDFEFLLYETPGNFRRRYKNIKSMFPLADLNFVRKTLALWSRRFKLKPFVWKMAEVSAKRVRYEEKYNPNSLQGFRVMLLNPPWHSGKRYGIRAGSRWPFTMEMGKADVLVPAYVPFPFFLAYATAVLKKKGINAVIADAIAEGLSDEEFLERVRGFSPNLVFIEAATASIENDLEWAKRLKDINENVKIAFVGTHVSALQGLFFAKNPEIDYLIVGEYEFAALELSESLKEGELPKDASGVIYRDENGKIVSNGRSRGILNLNDLPLPERITLPIYNYDDSGGTGTPSPTVQVMASRGCPFGCIFCLWPQVLYGNRTYRARCPESVADEMEMLVKEYGFKGIYFDDDTFNIGKERILKLCKEIKRKEIHVPWAIMARADTSDFETLKAMRDAGLSALKFGLESATQEIIDKCGKGLNINNVEESVNNCRKLGIRVHLTYVFGLPGETHETLKRTIAYALKLDSDSAQFSLATPFPGTKYHQMLQEKGLLVTKDWSKYDGNRYAVIRGENLSTKELEAALKKAQTEWDLHCRNREPQRAFLLSQQMQEQAIEECKGKIAIVDLFFTWPPRGGSNSDINAVGSQLVKHGFSVQMFVPFYTSPFTRGNIKIPTSFPIHQLQFNKNTFTPEIIARAFKNAIDMFEPDYVIVGDGWGLKPYIVSALKKYKVFLRFYAYENLCLMRHGAFLRDGAVCPYNFITHRERCLECINKEMAKRRTRHRLFDEIFISRGLTKEFHELVRKSIQQVHGIIVSNPIIADIVSSFNKNVYIIPGGVDIDKFNIHSHKGSKNGRANILIAGRVDDDTKGLNVLEAACGKLRGKRKDFFVTVTGVRKTNSSFIKLVGWHRHEDMPRLYGQADICVFPSIWPEPFGLGAVEAMAAGKPVIASNVVGFKQIIVDGETGFLVKPGDADDLAEKIEILLDNPKLRHTMGQAARKRAEEKYNWGDVFKRYYLPLFKCPREKKN